ncbi:hypothetical protein L873DRAFT_1802182 [Choiromyces venosus 120613-1]|uniref:Uncharacterized protein n=1 Tax=Choiromyces venosus 120613-1 TaxID=1336337 RepID=A0A3N4JV53_9PEZI|nr:hypothetical protein L873DRAFT_1802182 [Choiromyces venosus 120613-1]
MKPHSLRTPSTAAYSTLHYRYSKHNKLCYTPLSPITSHPTPLTSTVNKSVSQSGPRMKSDNTTQHNLTHACTVL